MGEKLLLGNCIELLGKMPDNSVDIVLTDPPYNISQEAKSLDRSQFKNRKMRRMSSVSLDYGNWDKMERAEFLDFTREWFCECARVLKPGGAFVSFFSTQDISLLAWIGEECDVRYRTFFTWVKQNPMPSIYRRNYLSATESVFIGSKGREGWTFNFTTQEEMRNIFIYPNKSVYGETDHPNEKPVPLLKHFLRIHTNKGDTVLDPFMGSCSTGVACLELERNFIGIEQDEKWYALAEARIRQRRDKGIQMVLEDLF